MCVPDAGICFLFFLYITLAAVVVVAVCAILMGVYKLLDRTESPMVQRREFTRWCQRFLNLFLISWCDTIYRIRSTSALHLMHRKVGRALWCFNRRPQEDCNGSWLSVGDVRALWGWHWGVLGGCDQETGRGVGVGGFCVSGKPSRSVAFPGLGVEGGLTMRKRVEQLAYSQNRGQVWPRFTARGRQLEPLRHVPQGGDLMLTNGSGGGDPRRLNSSAVKAAPGPDLVEEWCRNVFLSDCGCLSSLNRVGEWIIESDGAVW